MKNEKKVCLVFLRNVRIAPSSYYRIGQYIPFLEKKSEIEFKIRNFYFEWYYTLFKKNKILARGLALPVGTLRRFFQLCCDTFFHKNYVLFIQKSAFPRYIPYILRFPYKLALKRAKKVIWDFDDDIIDSGEISNYELSELRQKSNHIIVCNDFLKSKLGIKYQNKIILLPTTDLLLERIDTEKLNFERLETYNYTIKLIWVGTYGNLKYLYAILPALEEAATNIAPRKNLVLKIVSNGKINYPTKYLKIENISWTRSRAFEEFKHAHIGLMPLSLNYYTPGKCGFKAVQYIGMGLPTVASPVGFNKKVITHNQNGLFAEDTEQWANSITKLSTNKNRWLIMSRLAREIWEKKFDSDFVKNELSNLII
ncbi:glycosyltransferase [Mesoaciditoga lauensis]|uniref:glycosyltransferase n=1 Tax=Mesoaciditoga lauensis TaxID=1495039 RepID=UPI0014775DBA|nr:glycosyltransferase [Mesoaciditoga lauensis]